MRFVSTRGDSVGSDESCSSFDFLSVLLRGYAPDGGMFMPQLSDIPAQLEWQQWSALSYKEIVKKVLCVFIDNDQLKHKDLDGIVERVYSAHRFDVGDICGLKTLRSGIFVLELFHGPTLSFKDYALLLTVEILDYVLSKADQHQTVLTVTSGDTGSSVIEAAKGKKSLDTVVFYPSKKRISEMQRRMMTTVVADNVHLFGADASSDELDEVARNIFSDQLFSEAHNLSCLNSVNMLRLISQIPHWFYGYFKSVTTVGDQLTVAVPSGGGGNATAGLLAAKLGLPVKIVCCTGPNDTLHRLLQTGCLNREPVVVSLAPAMDIQIPYNLERMLFLITGDSVLTKQIYEQFERCVQVQLPTDVLLKMKSMLSSHTSDNQEIEASLQRTYQESEYCVCPHTATALSYAFQHLSYRLSSAAYHPSSNSILCFATASPFKFRQTLSKAGLQLPSADSKETQLYNAQENVVELQRQKSLSESLQSWEEITRKKIIDISSCRHKQKTT